MGFGRSLEFFGIFGRSGFSDRFGLRRGLGWTKVPGGFRGLRREFYHPRWGPRG